MKELNPAIKTMFVVLLSAAWTLYPATLSFHFKTLCTAFVWMKIFWQIEMTIWFRSILSAVLLIVEKFFIACCLIQLQTLKLTFRNHPLSHMNFQNMHFAAVRGVLNFIKLKHNIFFWQTHTLDSFYQLCALLVKSNGVCITVFPPLLLYRLLHRTLPMLTLDIEANYIYSTWKERRWLKYKLVSKLSTTTTITSKMNTERINE